MRDTNASGICMNIIELLQHLCGLSSREVYAAIDLHTARMNARKGQKSGIRSRYHKRLEGFRPWEWAEKREFQDGFRTVLRDGKWIPEYESAECEDNPRLRCRRVAK